MPRPPHWSGFRLSPAAHRVLARPPVPPARTPGLRPRRRRLDGAAALSVRRGESLLPLREKVAAKRPDEGSRQRRGFAAAAPARRHRRRPLIRRLRRHLLPQGEKDAELERRDPRLARRRELGPGDRDLVRLGVPAGGAGAEGEEAGGLRLPGLLDAWRSGAGRSSASWRSTASPRRTSTARVRRSRSGGDGLALDGDGEAVDYALEMRAFDPAAVLSEQPERVDGGAGRSARARRSPASMPRAEVRPEGGGVKALGFTIRTNAEQPARDLAAELGTRRGRARDRRHRRRPSPTAPAAAGAPPRRRVSRAAATATCTSATSCSRTAGRCCSTASSSTTS